MKSFILAFVLLGQASFAQTYHTVKVSEPQAKDLYNELKKFSEASCAGQACQVQIASSACMQSNVMNIIQCSIGEIRGNQIYIQQLTDNKAADFMQIMNNATHSKKCRGDQDIQACGMNTAQVTCVTANRRYTCQAQIPDETTP